MATPTPPIPETPLAPPPPPPETTPEAALEGTEGEVERVFRRFDVDGDGKISVSELGSVVEALGSHATPEEVREMIEEMDLDRDGFVDLKEFAEFHRRGSGGSAASGGGAGTELKDAFDMYDLDKNGLISVEELHLVLKRLGDVCSVQDCSRMIRSVDADGDGCVSFEEFKRMLAKKPIP